MNAKIGRILHDEPEVIRVSAKVGRILPALAKPAASALFIALALVLVAPSVRSGLGSDDYVIASQLRTPKTIPGLSRGIYDLFVFAPGEPSASHALMEQGVLPWWADPQAKIAFFRPLASLSHALDHAAWPDSPRVWHAHSILWFALSLLAVAALYRRILGETAAASVALLFFALDDAHGGAIGWLCARNGLMALTFSTAAIWAHARWRMEGWRAGAVLGPLLFALSLLSGEAGIAGCAYLFSYALFMDDGPLVRRFARLGAFGAVLVAWGIAWVKLGYGTSWTTYYLDPLREPGVFLSGLVTKLPILLLSQFFGPSADLWFIYPSISPRLPYLIWSFAILVLASIAAVVWPLLRRDRVARFFAFGAVSSLVPVCAGPPSDRVLLFGGIGAMALASLVVVRRFEEADIFRRPALRRLATCNVCLIIFWHVALNLYWLPVRSQFNTFFAPVFDRADASLPNSGDVATKTLVLINPPFEPLAFYFPFTRDANGVPRPKSARILTTGASPVAITRVDARTLRVRPDLGFLSSPADTMLRSARRPMPLGTVAELEDVSVEITEKTSDGRPAEALFRFRVPLEDPSFVWRKWGDKAYVPFEVPAIGETVRLEAVDIAALFAKDTT